MPTSVPTIAVIAMQKNLQMLSDRMRHLIPPLVMTHDECLELLAPPEHADILKNAAKFADIHASEGPMYGLRVPAVLDGVSNPQFQMTMRTHAGEKPPLKPRDPTWQGDAAACVRVMDWINARLVHGRKAATAIYVVNTLIDRCDTGEQLRFIFPPIMHLCMPNADFNDTGNDAVTRWATKHAHFKAVRSAPALTSEFRVALRDAAEWITSAVLLGSELPAQEVQAVDISTYGLTCFECCGLTLSRE